MSKSSVPMPQPSAAIIVLISSLPSILSKRAFSTFRILPLSGRIAWVRRSRPCFADPPAESPSTSNLSDSAGSLATSHFSSLPRCLARPGRFENLRSDCLGFLWVLQQEFVELGADGRLHD